MTRRCGFWIIGSALGLLPLTGCALWKEKPTILPAESHPAVAGPKSKAWEQIPDKPPAPVLPPAPMVEIEVERPVVDVHAAQKPPENPPVQPPAPPPALVVSLPVPREPLVAAMQCVFEDRPGEALQYLAKYDQPTQEFFLGTLSFLSLLAKNGIDQLSPADIDVLNKHLQDLSITLLPRTPLVIDKAFFCCIKDYGAYDKLPEGYAYVPYELMRVRVEPKNFLSAPTKDGFVTRLSWSFEIRDQNDIKVWPKKNSDSHPTDSQSFQQDNSKIYGWYLPPDLRPGRYTLIITLVDETQPEQKRQASRTLEFHVTSPKIR